MKSQSLILYRLTRCHLSCGTLCQFNARRPGLVMPYFQDDLQIMSTSLRVSLHAWTTVLKTGHPPSIHLLSFLICYHFDLLISSSCCAEPYFVHGSSQRTDNT